MHLDRLNEPSSMWKQNSKICQSLMGFELLNYKYMTNHINCSSYGVTCTGVIRNVCVYLLLYLTRNLPSLSRWMLDLFLCGCFEVLFKVLFRDDLNLEVNSCWWDLELFGLVYLLLHNKGLFNSNVNRVSAITFGRMHKCLCRSLPHKMDTSGKAWIHSILV